MKIVKKRMTEPGVFWTKETSIWEPIISKNGTPLCLPMKILNATYTYNPTYNRVWTGFFTIMF
jgi:hypothetical protein